MAFIPHLKEGDFPPSRLNKDMAARNKSFDAYWARPENQKMKKRFDQQGHR